MQEVWPAWLHALRCLGFPPLTLACFILQLPAGQRLQSFVGYGARVSKTGLTHGQTEQDPQKPALRLSRLFVLMIAAKSPDRPEQRSEHFLCLPPSSTRKNAVLPPMRLLHGMYAPGHLKTTPEPDHIQMLAAWPWFLTVAVCKTALLPHDLALPEIRHWASGPTPY